MIKNIVFDWSGTISNDLEAVYHTTRGIFHELGIAPLTFSHFQDIVEIPFRTSLERLFSGSPEILARFDDRERERELFDRYFAVCGPPKALPQAGQALQQLSEAGFTMAVFSAHHQRFLEQENAAFFNGRNFFSTLFGSASDKLKTFPALLEKTGFVPEETIFVGDTTHDILAGKAAGMKTAAVLTGYHLKEKLLSVNPDIILGSVAELPAALCQNLPRAPARGAF